MKVPMTIPMKIPKKIPMKILMEIHVKDHMKIHFYENEEVNELFTLAMNDEKFSKLIPYLTLLFFAGLRPDSEVARSRHRNDLRCPRSQYPTSMASQPRLRNFGPKRYL